MKTSGTLRFMRHVALAAGLAGLTNLIEQAKAQTNQVGGPSGAALAGNTSSFWDQQYLFGDWNGKRSWLADQGVTFDLNNIGDFQADVTGSQTHHATYFGRFRASADVNLQKLADYDGEFFISTVYQYGQNLSGRYLAVNTLSSSIAGVESYRLDQVWFQQGLFNHTVTIKAGQLVAVDEFGATDFFDLLFNDELGYAPNALFTAKQPFSPAGKPGIVIRTDLSFLTPGLYAKAGVFTAYTNAYLPDRYGVDYNDDFNHGGVISVEVGYQEQNSNYPGIYKLGFNGNDLNIYSNPSTGQNYRGDVTAYALAEKTVYHPRSSLGTLDLKKGLDLLMEFLGAPGDRNNLEFEFTTAARYTGLIPGRDKDKTGVGLIYSKNGGAYSDAYAASHGHGLGGETTVEADYQINPFSWFSFQLDSQYIVNPGGDSKRSEITVLGLRTIFRF